MGSHPVNLMIRFLLELTALASVGLWGWKSFDGTLQYVSGLIRLVIEFIFFALAVWVLYDLEYLKLSYALGGLVLIHYIVSYDRLRWLLAQKN